MGDLYESKIFQEMQNKKRVFKTSDNRLKGITDQAFLTIHSLMVSAKSRFFRIQSETTIQELKGKINNIIR
jgi:hypothetical protein